MKRLIVASLATLVITSLALAEPPSTFTAAKAIAKNKVFYDQASTGLGDLYCGCAWKWVGKSGGRIDAASCGYDTRAQQTRAERIEWEHRASLDLRPPTAVLAERWEEALRGGRPSLQGDGGQPF